MKKLLLVLALVLPITIAAADYEMVGWTTSTYQAAGPGWRGHHFRCQNDFGADARMCTTTEAVNSPMLSQFTTVSWVRPDYKFVSDGAGSFLRIDAVSGVLADDCLSWTTNSLTYRGLQIDQARIRTQACNGWASIVCCGPVQDGGGEPVDVNIVNQPILVEEAESK